MPLYQYWCPKCEVRTDLFASVEDRNKQMCPACKRRLVKEFVPTRTKPLVYANSHELYGSEFTGPKQKARLLRERGWDELGSESLDTIHRENRRAKQYVDEQIERETEKLVEREIVDRLGDSLFTTKPKRLRDAEMPRPDAEGPPL